MRLTRPRGDPSHQATRFLFSLTKPQSRIGASKFHHLLTILKTRHQVWYATLQPRAIDQNSTSTSCAKRSVQGQQQEAKLHEQDYNCSPKNKRSYGAMSDITKTPVPSRKHRTYTLPSSAHTINTYLQVEKGNAPEGDRIWFNLDSFQEPTTDTAARQRYPPSQTICDGVFPGNTFPTLQHFPVVTTGGVASAVSDKNQRDGGEIAVYYPENTLRQNYNRGSSDWHSRPIAFIYSRHYKWHLDQTFSNKAKTHSLWLTLQPGPSHSSGNGLFPRSA